MSVPGANPPGLVPEVARGHAVGSACDRRLVAIGLVIVVAPFLFGAVGSVMLAPEAIGPLVTLGIWVVLFVVGFVRTRRVHIECVAVLGCVLTLQLLLDLHTRHLGDIVVGALHLMLLVSGLRNGRRGARGAPSSDSSSDG